MMCVLAFYFVEYPASSSISLSLCLYKWVTIYMRQLLQMPSVELINLYGFAFEIEKRVKKKEEFVPLFFVSNILTNQHYKQRKIFN